MQVVGRTLISVVAALLIMALGIPEAGAQAPDESESMNMSTFGVEFGLFSPMTTFEDEMFGESKFESGAALGFSATGWFHENVGVRFKVVRSQTEGSNETFPLAPLAVQDPNQWSFSGELTGRTRMETGAFDLVPYVGVGVGMRHYTWQASRHNEDKFLALTGSLGANLRPDALGPFGLSLEVRGYRSQFEGFGIHGGNWRPGTPARPVPDEVGTDIGFYGGVVDKVWSNDVMFSAGVTWNY